jgi:hypothetical protein
MTGKHMRCISSPRSHSSIIANKISRIVTAVNTLVELKTAIHVKRKYRPGVSGRSCSSGCMPLLRMSLMSISSGTSTKTSAANPHHQYSIYILITLMTTKRHFPARGTGTNFHSLRVDVHTKFFGNPTGC